jgi:hypothetical protein
MLICSGTRKPYTPILIRNHGPVFDGMDWLLGQCRILQKKKIPLFVKFQHDEYIPVEGEDNLLMTVEMAWRYHESTLDPRDSPKWMDYMDSVWREPIPEENDEEEGSDSQSEDWDYCDFYY